MLRHALSLIIAFILLILPLEVRAQNGSPDTAGSGRPGSGAPSGDVNAADNPVKKVWTNDDLKGSPNDAGVSNSVAQRPSSSGSREKTALPRGRAAKWYSDQIARLQARIPPLDAQIAELQSGLDGKALGDGKSSQRPRFVKQDDWSNELRQLQTQRAGILNRINEMEDEARHNGIPDSALR